jgi:hypothetical protein
VRKGRLRLKKLSKFAAILCSTGALSLSLCFMNHKDLRNAEAASQSKIISDVSYDFAPVSRGNAIIRVSAEDQTMVENSPVSFGFLQQQNGQSVFFKKENADLSLNTEFKEDNYQRSSGLGKESSGPGFIPNFKGPIHLTPLE